MLSKILRYTRIPSGTNRFLANALFFLPIASIAICTFGISRVIMFGGGGVSVPLLILALALSLPSVIIIPWLNIRLQRHQRHR